MREFNDLEEPVECFPAQLINWSASIERGRRLGMNCRLEWQAAISIHKRTGATQNPCTWLSHDRRLYLMDDVNTYALQRYCLKLLETMNIIYEEGSEAVQT